MWCDAAMFVLLMLALLPLAGHGHLVLLLCNECVSRLSCVKVCFLCLASNRLSPRDRPRDRQTDRQTFQYQFFSPDEGGGGERMEANAWSPPSSWPLSPLAPCSCFLLEERAGIRWSLATETRCIKMMDTTNTVFKQPRHMEQQSGG